MRVANDVDERLAAAEEVCWSLMLMVSLGGLEDVPQEWRPLLGDPLLKWCNLAVVTGVMRADDEAESPSLDPPAPQPEPGGSPRAPRE